jgi:hypothetical protein
MTIFASDAGTLLMQLAIAAARSTILAAIAGLLLAAFRAKGTHIRLCTWTAVLYAGVGMPLLGMLPVIEIPVPFAAPTAPRKIVQDVSPTTAAAVRQSVQEIEPVAASSTSLSNAPPPSKTHSSWSATITSLPWTMSALALYIVIGLVLLTRLLVGVVLARRLVRNSIPIHDPRLTGKECRWPIPAGPKRD